MEKLTLNGQAVLCTVHQPSSLLFQRFDRLLLLTKGGRTVYFGDVGSDSHVLLEYFARNGGPECPAGMNPAEYMLAAIGAAPGASTEVDWPSIWKTSPEYEQVGKELARLRDLAKRPSDVAPAAGAKDRTFAASTWTQITTVTFRVAQQYWRTPSYIYSKAILTILNSLLIGFSFFDSGNTSQGLQNQMFGVFVFLFIIIQLMLQIFPMFSMISASDLPNYNKERRADCLDHHSYATDLVRSPRTPVQDLWVGSFPHVQHQHRNDVECRECCISPSTRI